ncbi:MAG: helix-turn-helix transcriptional regulator [Bacillota bacterium]|nr:helix-turn-helix transcriptional regulator [Bacillota bacterium]
MTIGRKIRYLREINNISQKQLSKILNVSQQTISQYENNRRNVPSGALKPLANFFSVATDYFLDNNGNTSTDNILMIQVDDPVVREEIEKFAKFLIKESNKKKKLKIERNSK